MADLSEILDKVHQLGGKDQKLEAVLSGTSAQLAQVVQQVKSLVSAGGSTEAAQLQAISASLDQTMAGVDMALSVHQSESSSQVDNIHATEPAPTGDPANPLQNDAPANPPHTDVDPAPGETGDSANPVQNAPAPNPVPGA
jgi:hypothetical protein